MVRTDEQSRDDPESLDLDAEDLGCQRYRGCPGSGVERN